MGAILDDVVLAEDAGAVDNPEPAALALVLPGLCALGFAVKRRGARLT